MKAAQDVAGMTEASMGMTPPRVETDQQQAIDRPLFDEYYEDWASFDAAIARATAAYHPIRKRSSLTFEVYNRTVSKGRHDRKNIAEFLSKTFKCTHGIKFRSRGSGKRMRHKLRDIGCPFHVYASAVEFGLTYRIKVRTHDKHNHPIGPDSMKMMSGTLHESDYDLATATTNTHRMDHVMASDELVDAGHAAYDIQIREQMAEVEAQQAQAQAVAQVEAEAQSQAYQMAQVQGMIKDEAEGQTMTSDHVNTRAQMILQSTDVHPQSQSVETSDIVSDSGHDSEAFGGVLDATMDSTMGDEVFVGAAAPRLTPADAAVAANSSIEAASSNGVQEPAKFEETMTFESLRKRIAEFAEERDWNHVSCIVTVWQHRIQY